MSLNKVMLIGNVGQDPEVRYAGDQTTGAKVATLRLATSEKYRDRSGVMQEITEWHSVVMWRGLADLAEKYIRKGTQIYVEGRLRTRSWEDQNKNKRYMTEIVADNVELLGRRTDNPATGGGYSSPARQGGYSQAGYQSNAGQGGYSQPAPQGGYAQPAASQGGYQSNAGQGGYAQPAAPSQPQAAPAAQPARYSAPAVPSVQDDDDLPF